jgi:hypothetical protein
MGDLGKINGRQDPEGIAGEKEGACHLHMTSGACVHRQVGLFAGCQYRIICCSLRDTISFPMVILPTATLKRLEW